ncbi:sulfurtransferase-like selenium metabolism protein YedF [Sulfurospirillum sp. 1307]|jgi:selenium metabolism protein YedF
MKTLDFRDMPVPKPVILAKNTIDELPEDASITIIVNCEMSEDNILTYAQSKGFFVRREEKSAGVFITIAKNFSCDIDSHFSKQKEIENCAFIITHDCIGKGLQGDTLMQEFLDSILAQKVIPSKIVFLNQGVKLTCLDEESATIKTLKKLEEKGVNILVSLTSLKELDLHKKNIIGRKVSMYELVEIMIHQKTSTI